MISIRLSEEEYNLLCHLSAETGANSLSDMAREGMRLLFSRTDGQQLVDPVKTVQAQVEDLSRRIDELRFSSNSLGGTNSQIPDQKSKHGTALE